MTNVSKNLLIFFCLVNLHQTFVWNHWNGSFWTCHPLMQCRLMMISSILIDHNRRSLTLTLICLWTVIRNTTYHLVWWVSTKITSSTTTSTCTNWRERNAVGFRSARSTRFNSSLHIEQLFIVQVSFHLHSVQFLKNCVRSTANLRCSFFGCLRFVVLRKNRIR